MSKIKLLSIAVITLLVLNLGTVGYLLLGNPQGSDPDGGQPQPPSGHGQLLRTIIAQELDLDDEQTDAYELLIDKNRERTNDSRQSIRRAKDALFMTLQEPASSKSDSLIEIILEHQRVMERSNVLHFRELKELLRPEQMDSFNELTTRLGRLLAPKRPNGMPHGGPHGPHGPNGRGGPPGPPGKGPHPPPKR